MTNVRGDMIKIHKLHKLAKREDRAYTLIEKYTKRGYFDDNAEILKNWHATSINFRELLELEDNAIAAVKAKTDATTRDIYIRYKSNPVKRAFAGIGYLLGIMWDFFIGMNFGI